jgi:hypothetical protein
MAKSLSRYAIDALLPPGALWQPEPGEDFDLQLDGLADEVEDIKATIDTLADIRNPSKTPVFEDLERNYGIKPNENVSDSVRVARLDQKVYQGAKVNSIDDVQAELITAGFDLQVHKNDPAIDPAIFLAQSFQITAGSDKAYAGYHEGGPILAFAASLGGELLVNTDITKQEKAILMQAGGDIAYAGYSDGPNTLSIAGYHLELKTSELEYPIPTDSKYWPKMPFIGGDATRDPVTGAITAIAPGLVDLNRKDDLKALLLSDKTLGAWFSLIINFV